MHVRKRHGYDTIPPHIPLCIWSKARSISHSSFGGLQGGDGEDKLAANITFSSASNIVQVKSMPLQVLMFQFMFL
jgi:hypothetical protein